MLKFLRIVLAGVPNEQWENKFISYDNMCNIDRLKFLQENDEIGDMWKKVGKVIDPLHMGNHRRPECKVEYSKDKCEAKYPQANLMIAEQVTKLFCMFDKS